VASQVTLPRLGQGMESGTIIRWLKSEGDPVEKGEPLYELDTEKVTQEVEAEATGILLKILVPEGEVAVGKTVAIIGEQGEEIPAVSDESETAGEEPTPEQEQEQEQEREPTPTQAQDNGGRAEPPSGVQ
jgi:pyruvate dehydrogenase E2 component (dihydrolipoyllysine-residue acetyltransferase)